MAETDIRASRFERQMSPAEALMWNVEKDPWLNPSGGSLSLVDGPLDPEVIDRWLRATVAAVPRLRERVVPGFGRFERPSWRPDPEFDFGYHVRYVDLPGAGTERELLDLVAVLFQEPYDRTRPLWQIVVFGGLEGDRSALLMKLHHSIADGYGMGRMQERFMVRSPDAAVPAPVDLDAVVVETVAAADRESGSSSPLDQVADLVRRPAAIAEKALGRAALLAADPTAWGDVVSSARGMAGMVAGQLRPADEGATEPAGSPLWTGRSRHRHLEAIRLPLEDTKRAAKALDASINDVFMTGLLAGAVAHHEARGVAVSAFNTSFVVSTRQDRAEGGNSFSPVRVRVPGGVMSPVERVRAVQERVGRQRDSFHGGGLMGSLAGVVNLLPTSLTTQVARSQAARVDFATTNVRGSSRPLYIGGQMMTGIFAPGPVAGSAMIAAVISYLDTMNVMLTIDPVAIPEPGALKADIERAYDELFEAV